MSRSVSEDGQTPSIIDRLIDSESEGTSWRRGYSIEQMMETVRRDVEDLLNTHRPGDEIPAEFVETRNSILAFGLPDLASYYGMGAKLKDIVGRAIEQVIASFEPRLRDVRATVLTSDADGQLKMQFQITAKLCVDPSPEVSFVTVLQLTTGQATVQPGGD